MQPNLASSSYKYSYGSSSQGQTQNPSNFETQAIAQTVLKWSSLGQGNDTFVVSSESDISTLRNLKNVLLTLHNQFTQQGPKVVFAGEKRQDFNKRLILLENEIQGLMKRKIEYGGRVNDGSRVLDYTGILNEKENQIVELEKKINNLQQRLRKATTRQIELENEVSRLFQEIKVKDKIVFSKNQVILGEVASSNLLKQALQKAGIQLPNIGSLQIRAENLTVQGATSRSSVYQQLPDNKKNKTQLVQLFRQFQKVNSTEGISSQEIDRTLEGFILNLQGSKLRESVEVRLRRRKVEEDYERLQSQFGAAVSIFQSQMERIKAQNSSIKIDTDPQIYEMLKQHKINVYKTAGDVLQLERFSQRTIQVPVQDARTKHLLHLFASQLKKFTAKYPKLEGEMDSKLKEFFQQELIDVIEVDQVDKLIEIVKYIPQVVKVQNVYAYSSEKSRKIEFHLRVLVKALLQELQKVRRKTGVVLELDEGVIGMINQQIMGVVDVDDILKVFRVVPKIVQVEKIVQKIVDRIVEVPQIVTVEKIVQKIVQVQKIREVEKIVNVPLEMPVVVTNLVQKIVPIERIIERIIEVPHIIEKIIEITKEVPKIVTVQKFVDRIVQVEKIVEVEKIINHVQHEIRQIVVTKEVIVPTQEKIIEKIVQVPVIVQKIVERVVQVPQVIEVEKIVEKIVTVIEYRNAKQVENHIEVRHQIVDRIIEKPIPIIQLVEKIVEVPQIVEKIIQTNTIVKEPYEVPVIREKIVVQDRIKQIEVIRDRLVIQTKQVIKQVQRIVQVPIIVEKIVKVQEIVQKPIIQRSEQTIIKQVYLRDPQIIKEPKIVQVEKIINNYIQVPKPVKYIEEKIVEVIRHVDRIKQVRVPVEKIIEKMVEVPKVVEVQKIVERIVVVPRVVEKIVEVPQIVERIVQKIIIEERIKEVQRIIQKPVIQQRPVEIQTVKNVYIEVQKIVDRIVDKLVEVPRYEEKIINNDVIIQKIIEVIKEVPKQLEVEKLVYNTIEVAKPVEIERQIIVPIQVPIPVEKVIQKIVPVTQVIEKIVQVPQIVQKIVAQRAEQVRIHEVVRVQEKVVVDQRIKEVIKEVPYINEKIKQVVVEREKIVPIQSIVQQIVTAQQIIEKVVEKAITVPKIHEVERTKEIVVEVPKIVEVERIIPQLVNVNRYIEKIVQKIVEVPVIVQQIKEIVKQNEKVVQVRNQYQTIKEVERIVEKAVIMQKFKEVVRNINHIEKVLQIIDRYEQIPVQVIAHEQRFVEVPVILQKIVEKIVIMPQIVEVLKYVHQIIEQQSLGVKVEQRGEILILHSQRVSGFAAEIKTNLLLLISELKKLNLIKDPIFSKQIAVVEQFIVQFQSHFLSLSGIRGGERILEDTLIYDQKAKLDATQLQNVTVAFLEQVKRLVISYPTINNYYLIHQTLLGKFMTEIYSTSVSKIGGAYKEQVREIIEREKIVRVPTQDQRSIKMELTLSLLVEKLILQLKKIKKANPSMNLQLEDDIKLIFFPELESITRSVGDDFNLKLKQFSDTIYKKFQSLGSWSFDHQMMLNSFLQERFLMANLVKNTNLEIEKSKTIQVRREQALKDTQAQLAVLEGVLSKFRGLKLQGVPLELSSVISNIFVQFDQFKQSNKSIEPMRQLLELQVTDERIQSLIREKDAQILKLRSRIFQIEKSRTISTSNESQNQIIKVLQSENLKLKNEINDLRTSKGSAELVSGYKSQISQLNERILELQQEKSNLNAELSNLKRQYEVKLQLSSSIKDSILTKEKSQFRSPEHMVSPVSKYTLGSPQQPDYGIRLVDSKIEDNRGTGLTQSRQSQEASYRVATSTAKEPNSDEASRSSTYYGGQGGLGGQYQNAYQYGTGSGTYSSTSSAQREGTNLTGQYGQNTASDVYRSGSYQPTASTLYPPSSTYQPPPTTYQPSTTYQPYQGGQSTFRSGSSQVSGSNYQYSSGTSQTGNTTQGSNFQGFQYKKP